MKHYLSEDGTPITEEMIAGWAREAEEGFPHSTITRDPDPFPPSRNDMKAHTIRIPDELWALVEAAARIKHITPSEYTRQALGHALAQSGLSREQKVMLYAQTHDLTRDEAVNALLDQALA